MAQERINRPPSALLRAAADRDSRAKENRRFQQGTVLGLDLLGRTARVSVGYFDGNGSETILETVPFPAGLNPSVGDVVTLDYPHSNPQSVRITTVSLAGSNSQKTLGSTVSVEKDGVGVGSEKSINFKTGTGTTLTVTDVPGSQRVDVEIDASAASVLPTPTKPWDILIANASLVWQVAQVIVDTSGNLVTDNGELTVAAG